MRSRISQKIIDETAPEVRGSVMRMSDELVRRHQEIESIVLTEEEISYALWSAKVGKWNQIRNEDYWKEQEAKKVKDSSRNVGVS